MKKLILITMFLIFGVFGVACFNETSPINHSADDYKTIKANYKTMTYLEWEDYTKSLNGQYFDGTGVIVDIKKKKTGDYQIFIDMGGGTQDICWEDRTRSLVEKCRKDDKIFFFGNITSIIATFFRVFITIK